MPAPVPAQGPEKAVRWARTWRLRRANRREYDRQVRSMRADGYADEAHRYAGIFHSRTSRALRQIPADMYDGFRTGWRALSRLGL